MTSLLHKEATRKNRHYNAHLYTPQDILVSGVDNPNGSRSMSTTATVYGGQIHLTHYRTPLTISPFHKRKTYQKAKISTRRENNINRARRNVYRLVMQNFKMQPIRFYQNPLWCAFTYPDSDYAKIQNRKSHIKDFQEFFRELRLKYGEDIKYLAVMELTQKKNVHFHVMIFNMPKYQSPVDVAQIWIDLNARQGRVCSHGAQHVKRIPWGYKNARKSAEDIAGYLSKYLAKTFQEFDYGHMKMYLPSKGLEQPVSITTLPELLRLLEDAVVNNYFITYTSGDYEVPYIGTVAIQILEPTT
jgi:hypothetical protein